MRDWPRVTVVMPCYNEERYIGNAIRGLVDDYFRENCELVVVDGESTDGTKEIVRSFIEGDEAKRHGLERAGQVRLLDNPRRIQSYGLNLGIKEARGEIIVRADAHCVFPAGYIRKCVELLETAGAANVGGVMAPVVEKTDDEKNNKNKGKRKTPYVSWAIALALQHPAGVGDARFHLGNYSGDVDTVYLGAFWKSLFDEIGLFDTNAPTNEDAELNVRILRAGKKIYLDSSIKVGYFPRETLRQLAKQYFKYGRGRCYTVLKHRRVTSWRQVAPVVLVAGLVGAVAVSFVRPWALLFPASYVAGLVVATFLYRERPQMESDGKENERRLLRFVRKDSIVVRLLVAVAWMVMHISWGLGFWNYLIFRKKKPRDCS